MGEILAGVEKVSVIALLIFGWFLWNDLGEFRQEFRQASAQQNEHIIQLNRQYGQLTGKLDLLIQLQGGNPAQAAKP